MCNATLVCRESSGRSHLILKRGHDGRSAFVHGNVYCTLSFFGTGGRVNGPVHTFLAREANAGPHDERDTRPRHDPLRLANGLRRGGGAQTRGRGGATALHAGVLLHGGLRRARPAHRGARRADRLNDGRGRGARRDARVLAVLAAQGSATWIARERAPRMLWAG